MIIFVILAFVIVGAIYAVIIKVPKYTATTKLVLAQSDVSSASVSEITTAELSLNDKLIATYKEIAKSSSVVRSVIDNLGLDMTEDELKSRISITAVTSTQILLVSYTDYDQDRVARITNEIADVFSKRISELYKVNIACSSGVNLLNCSTKLAIISFKDKTLSLTSSCVYFSTNSK